MTTRVLVRAGKFARHGVVVAAVCVVVALTLSLSGNRPLGLQLLYSMSIGLSSWVIADFGRLWLRPDPQSGWPSGIRLAVLVLTAASGGYVIGTSIADWIRGGSTWSLSDTDPRRVFAYVALSAGVCALVMLGFWSSARERLYQARLAKVESDAAAARLALLQSQLEPHMLFNTLANLRVLIGLDPPRAQAMLDRLNGYLRATLSASRAITHPLSVEFERTADYLALMALRMGARLEVQLALPADVAQHPVPTLILQPLVENAIKHGLEPKLEGGRLRVAAHRDGAHLVLEVLDSGLGLPARSAGPLEGFGTTQVRERLRTLHGPAASFTLGSAPDGSGATLARITLPWSPASP